MFCGPVMQSVHVLLSAMDAYSIKVHHVILAIAVGALLPICLISCRYVNRWRVRSAVTDSTVVQTSQGTVVSDPSDDTSARLSELLGVAEIRSDILEDIYDEPTTPSMASSHDQISDADIESSIISELEPIETRNIAKCMLHHSLWTLTKCSMFCSL